MLLGSLVMPPHLYRPKRSPDRVTDRIVSGGSFLKADHLRSVAPRERAPYFQFERLCHRSALVASHAEVED
jgi:hypothetical protein